MFTSEETAIINRSLDIIESKRPKAVYIGKPHIARNHAILLNAHYDVEVFSVFFLNAQYGIIEIKGFGTGTINQLAVYPREIAKRALQLNASAVILTHNHPSGTLELSESDIIVTKKIVEGLRLFDIMVLDHFVTGFGKAVSMAELGII